MACYKQGGCGVYEMRSCNECPASKLEYANKNKKAPNVEAEPVVHGEWDGWTTSAYIGINADKEPKWADRRFFRCTLCRHGTVVKSNYCPSCGAKMDKEEA